MAYDILPFSFQVVMDRLQYDAAHHPQVDDPTGFYAFKQFSAIKKCCEHYKYGRKNGIIRKTGKPAGIPPKYSLWDFIDQKEHLPR